ncbi:M16 family metallopeptidase [Candidatus Omnitrophota bacterium]
MYNSFQKLKANPYRRRTIIRYVVSALIIVTLLMASVFSAFAEGPADEYHKTILDNGATIVSTHVPESPLVSIQIRILAGLSSEGEYAGTGISHFLEHLLFMGTGDKSSEDVRSQIKAMGGVTNAAAGMDATEFYIVVPNEKFEEALDLLAEVVMNPVFTDEQLETERDVILKEIKLHEDDPMSRRIRLLFSQAYREHVYKYPIIGYEDTFKELTREDVLRYHAAAYAPNRMVIGIAGGVSSERAMGVAKEKFEKYQRGRFWPADVSSEPRQVDERKASFPADVMLGYMTIGFHTTDLFSPDLYPGDVLSVLLGEGNDSRLHKRLVKDMQLLYTVSSMNYTPKYPGLFVVTGIGEPDKLERAAREIFAVIDELKYGKIQDAEIERVKNLVIADYFYSHERIKEVASSMTSSQILTGDPAFFEKYVEEIKKVGSIGVKDIAFRYLTRDNSTTIFLVPRGYQEEKEVAPPVETVILPEEAEKIDEEAVVFKNGLRVIVKKKGRLPLVSVTLAVPGGLRAEDKNTNGISNLTASLMLKGTKRRDEDEIIPVLESLGGSIGSFSGMNSLGITMDLMADDLDAGMDIFEDVIKNAIFPKEEILKKKEKIIAAIQEQEKDIFKNGMLQLRGLLYGDHPYAMRILGEARTVDFISQEELRAFHKDHFAPENAVLTVVGDVYTAVVLNDLKKRFAGWRLKRMSGIDAREEEQEGSKVAPLSKRLKKNVYMQKEQSLDLLGFQGVDVHDQRRHALFVISAILSGSDGLLFSVVREQEGLAYVSGAANVPEVDPGYFFLYAATTEQNVKKAEERILDILKKIINGDITEEEIESSKRRLISQHAYSLETNSVVSITMALDELYGLGFQEYKRYPTKINAVSKDDIIKCAREIFDLDGYATVIVHSTR